MSKPSSNFIKFKTKSGRKTIFSKGILSRTFYAIGLDEINAYELATQIELQVGKTDKTLSQEAFSQIIIDNLEKFNPLYAQRYIAFEQKGVYKPIIILLAGVPGIGKSTIASLLSRRLEITNIIGTDMVREILRQSISKKLVPELYGSSYEAYKYLKPEINPILDRSIVGFEEQSRLVIVGVEAIIESAMYSRENTIIEGVHLSPNLFKTETITQPHVMLFLLHLKDEHEHLERFKRRGLKVVERNAERYINAFEEIRTIQKYLVEEANRHRIPIIETQDQQRVIHSLLDAIWGRILLIIKNENKKKEKNDQ